MSWETRIALWTLSAVAGLVAASAWLGGLGQ